MVHFLSTSKAGERSEQHGWCLQEHKPGCVFKIPNKMDSKLILQTRTTWKGIVWLLCKVSGRRFQPAALWGLSVHMPAHNTITRGGSVNTRDGPSASTRLFYENTKIDFIEEWACSWAAAISKLKSCCIIIVIMSSKIVCLQWESYISGFKTTVTSDLCVLQVERDALRTLQLTRTDGAFNIVAGSECVFRTSQRDW